MWNIWKSKQDHAEDLFFMKATNTIHIFSQVRVCVTIDASEGIDFNKTNESCKCIKNNYYYLKVILTSQKS